MQPQDSAHLVRSARLSDAGQLVELLRQIGREANEMELEAKLKKMQASGRDEVLVETRCDIPVGFISTTIFESLYAYRLGRITALVVDETYRRHGIGRSLMRSAEVFFRQNGCHRVEIAAGDFRGDARAFYGAMGYVAGERTYLKTPGQFR